MTTSWYSVAPRVKEEDVKQLVEMFPTLEKDVIHSVLEASNGNVDSAVTNLLQMTEAQ
jgi:toll-interacting protein